MKYNNIKIRNTILLAVFFIIFWMLTNQSIIKSYLEYESVEFLADLIIPLDGYFGTRNLFALYSLPLLIYTTTLMNREHHHIIPRYTNRKQIYISRLKHQLVLSTVCVTIIVTVHLIATELIYKKSIFGYHYDEYAVLNGLLLIVIYFSIINLYYIIFDCLNKNAIAIFLTVFICFSLASISRVLNIWTPAEASNIIYRLWHAEILTEEIIVMFFQNICIAIMLSMISYLVLVRKDFITGES